MSFPFVGQRGGRSSVVPLSATAHLSLLREIEAAGVGSFWATNADGKLIYLSEKAQKSLGSDSEKLIGRDLISVFKECSLKDDADTQRSLAFRMRTQAKITDQVVEISLDESGVENASALRWWQISARPYFDKKGEFCGYRGTSADITSEFRHQQNVARQSQYDELTGLANRRRLQQRLTTTLNAFKTAGRSCALMMLDLDRFKQVNDTMGHPAGDELLKQVAERLCALIKDSGEVGRLGGDEFQILLPDMDDRGDLGELAKRIIQMLSQPYSLSGRRAIIGASVGIAIAPYDGVDTDELVGAVDLALYAAKAGGRGTYCFYRSELRDNAAHAATIEEDLRDAVEKGQLLINYQPLVDPADNRVKSFEALMRWEHPEKGRISPEAFIPVAEQTDLIIKLGNWALRQACTDAVNWPGDICVAVNVSAKQFMNADFTRQVATSLKASGLAPSRLELEITESVFVGNVEAVDRTFAALKKMGVRLAMDDFGTGYSSLGYLKRAPFNKIKIDQSFVRGCTESGDTNPAIISAIVALAKALDMETVAEGVEAMDELKLVKERGADLIQGYIYSKPLTQADLLQRFEESKLTFKPEGPPRYRADRISVFRKIGLIHEDHYYDVMLRNLSPTGARIEGLGEVTVGTQVVLDLGSGQLVVSKVVHATETSQGVEFETKLISDGFGGLMTRHRVSPYALAEAGMPLAALGSGSYSLAQWSGSGDKRPPKFVQLALS
jgi:diguanylate cyclase (GGDEF)-like protein/PAS domain S-box-containing protein